MKLGDGGDIGGVGGPTTRQADWVRRVALHYLERYASSERNLARVLRRKLRRRAQLDPERWTLEPQAADALIDGAVSACRALGLVDDTAFVEMKVAGGRRRGHSTRRIVATMTAKGVARELAEAAFSDGAADERRAALVFAHRRKLGPFRTSPRPGVATDPRDIDRRDMAALCRQGFAYALAKSVVTMDRSAAVAALDADPEAVD
ncbi:MAG TPA: RecX family transcriptional regulator [Methylomirabilota bacterium]|nr:RecX family transcriptional regulator [Methylomirabilota bacterium]